MVGTALGTEHTRKRLSSSLTPWLLPDPSLHRERLEVDRWLGVRKKKRIGQSNERAPMDELLLESTYSNPSKRNTCKLLCQGRETLVPLANGVAKHGGVPLLISTKIKNRKETKEGKDDQFVKSADSRIDLVPF